MKRRWVVMLCLCCLPGSLAGQEAARLVRVLDVGSGYLYETRAAAASRGRLAVLTAPSPAIHILDESGNAEWGDEGRGPGELMQPADLTWPGRIAILDAGNRRIEVFDESGVYLRSRGLGTLWANRIDIVRGDTILGAFTPMADERAVLRIRGSAVDTVHSYSLMGQSLRLQAEGAPSLTVKTPFTPQSHWAVLPTAGLVLYEPGSSEIRFHGRTGQVVASVSVDWEGYASSTEDREWWIESTIPLNFMGRPVFEPLRAVARRQVDFPDRLPAVLGVEADPNGGAWVKRSTSRAGEVWRLLYESGAIAGDVQLPAGRELLAVSAEGMFVLARDEFDVEFVEIYERPRWAK